MKVINNLNEYEEKEETFVTVGTFDGIHLGHQEILRILVEKSRERGKKNILVTFYPHPQMVVNSKYDNKIELLTTPEEKLEILRNCNLDLVVYVRFTREFSEIKPEEFVEEILIGKLNACGIVVGYDHAFGKARRGRIELLREYGEKRELEIIEVEPYLKNGKPASSTLIRQLLKTGRVQDASYYLGTNYKLSGKVIHGSGRGKRSGYPTANLSVGNPAKLIPEDGVYIVKIFYNDIPHNGMLYIGTRSTYGETERVIEVHIFNFSKEIYGESIKVEFLKRIRGDIQFENEDLLLKQIDRDKEDSMEYFNNLIEEEKRKEG